MMLGMMLAAILTGQADPQPATANMRSPIAETEAPPEQAGEQTARPERERDNLICTTRRPTGSTMRRNVCRPERRVRADESAAQYFMGEITKSGNSKPLDVGPE